MTDNALYYTHKISGVVWIGLGLAGVWAPQKRPILSENDKTSTALNFHQLPFVERLNFQVLEICIQIASHSQVQAPVRHFAEEFPGQCNQSLPWHDRLHVVRTVR